MFFLVSSSTTQGLFGKYIFGNNNLVIPLDFLSFKPQKASASSAAMVSEYIGYLEKGQIPPKVLILVV